MAAPDIIGMCPAANTCDTGRGLLSVLLELLLLPLPDMPADACSARYDGNARRGCGWAKNATLELEDGETGPVWGDPVVSPLNNGLY